MAVESTWQLILVLCVLVVVIVFLLKPTYISTPWRYNIPVDFSTVPVCSVVVLLVTTVLSVQDVFDALVGDERMRPYEIIILFFALAYMSISIDQTGVFDFLAVKAVLWTNGVGRRLFVVFFALSSIITIATSNDIVILTITPIICSLSTLTNTDPKPMLFAQFFAANLWSMALYIGNPTNIIAQAQGVKFLEYSVWMIAPTIACGVVCFGILYTIFKSQVPLAITIPSMNPWSKFRDPKGAIFAGSCFGLCILLLAVNVLPIRIYAITAIFAAVSLSKDVVFDVLLYHRGGVEASTSATTMPSPATENAPLPPPITVSPTKPVAADAMVVFAAASMGNGYHSHSDLDDEAHLDIDVGLDDVVPELPQPSQHAAHSSNNAHLAEDSEAQKAQQHSGPVGEAGSEAPESPYASIRVLKRLPWPIIPFVVGVFVIVKALSIVGVTEGLALGFSGLIGPADSVKSVILASVWMGFASALTCQILNNQPMTILFTRIIEEPVYIGRIGPASYRASMFSLIMGSNLGGSLTIVGALAGIMWISILRARGYTLSAMEFAKFGFLVIPPVLLVGTLVIALEHLLFY